MTNSKELIWLSPGADMPASSHELARHWGIHTLDLTTAPPRRPAALSRARVGVIDLTGYSPQTPYALEDWIEALSPTPWIGLLSGKPHQNSPLSDIVAAYCADYHTLPCDMLRLDNALGHLWGMSELMARRKGSGRLNFQQHALEGQSPAVRETRALLRRLAQTSEPVLVMGESGTGKNAAARFIHDHSAMCQGPFIAVNCAALPPTLTQSELFGHEKGAFTHALSARTGRIEQANGGTLVFQEIDELLPEQQSTLLRFLQEGVFERLGSDRPRHVRVRVIATSTRSLETMVSTDQFRADIYYRLGNLQVCLPPLRDRLEDLPCLAEDFIRASRQHNSHRHKRLSEEGLACLLNHNWPGNLRELHNRLQRAILLSETDTLTAIDLGLNRIESFGESQTQLSLARFRARAEREAITHCLNLSNNNVSAAARLLRISRLSLYRLMAKHGTGTGHTVSRREPNDRKGDPS